MSKKLAQIFHFDSFWKREEKYDKLTNTDFQDVPWQELNTTEPYYFFVPKDFWEVVKYDEGFSVSEIFNLNSSWIKTHHDKELVSYNKFETEYNTKYFYRVLDNHFINYDRTVVERDRYNLMQHILWKSNLSIVVTRQLSSTKFHHVFAANWIVDMCYISNRWKESWYIFPLYHYQENQDSLLWKANLQKTPNFNPEIISKIEQKLWIKLNIDFTPEDLFDYIYAVLHSKSYRETYKEFLKIDFPKVPFDIDKQIFFKMVELWKGLRSYHLMENENLIPKNFITKYEIDWDNLVEKVRYEEEKVFINDTQYFSGVQQDIWEFYIWGYQPAQKWLKDRKGRNLCYEDILHYSKIVLCLKETIRIMDEIERVFKV